MPISEGSLYNFNRQAYEQLAEFKAISKDRLITVPCLHADETGINIKRCTEPRMTSGHTFFRMPDVERW